MRRAGEDDLEVLPVAAESPSLWVSAGDGSPQSPKTTDDRPERRRRWRVVAGFALAAAAIGATVVVVSRPRDDPAADARQLVDAWARAQQVTDVADRAAVRVRILVPTGDSDVAFRGLAAVRGEERDRLHALTTDVTAIDGRDTDVARARDAVARALSVRERKARVAADFYAARGNTVRNLESIERALAMTAGEVARALTLLQRSHPVHDDRPPPALESAALGRSLGPLARVVDEPLGTRLLLNIDGRLVLFDPDAHSSRQIATLDDQTALSTLVTLGDGTVLAWDADGGVRAVDASRARPRLGPTIGHGMPIPSIRPGAVWLSTSHVATEVALDGTTLAGPFRQPGGELLAATREGLLLYEPGSRDAVPVASVWSPAAGTTRPVAHGSFVAAGSDRVVTQTCADATCTLHVTDLVSGTARDVDRDRGRGAEWSFGSAAMSSDGRWLVVETDDVTVSAFGLLFVDLISLDTHLVPIPPPVDNVARALVWSHDDTRVFGVNQRGNEALWASPDSTRIHPIRVQVAYEDVIRVGDVVPVE